MINRNFAVTAGILLLLGGLSIWVAWRSILQANGEAAVSSPAKAVPAETLGDGTPPPEHRPDAGPRESAAAESLIVTVRDKEGRPIVDASVSIHNSRGVELASRLAATDGTIRFTSAERPLAGSLQAQAEGFVTAQRSFDAQASAIDVVLVALQSIHGKVVLAGGEGAGPGYWVLAQDTLHEPHSLGVINAEMQERDKLLLVQTDSDGSFMFAGLPPGHQYRLYAGGAGHATLRAMLSRPEGSESIVLTAHKTFAAIVRFQESNHTPLRLYDGFLKTHPYMTRWTDQIGARPVPSNPISLLLGGMPISLLETAPTGGLFAVTAHDGVPEVGPVYVRIRAPGYAEQTFHYFARPIDSEIEEYTFLLTPVANGWSEVHVVATGLSPQLREHLDGQPMAGSLVLQAPDGREDSFPLLLRDEGGAVIDEVPLGKYRAVYRSKERAFQYPGAGDAALEVDVVQEGARVSIDFSNAGALALDIRDDAGEEYKGPVEAMAVHRESLDSHGRQGPRYKMNSLFESIAAPHGLFPIDAGDYALLMIKPRLDGHREGDGQVPFTITPGGKAVLELR